MLSISPAVRIFVHALPTDMRKHFDGLSAIVTQSFGKDVLRGDYFVFLNRSCDRCKILLWDRDGLVVWAKKLETEDTQIFVFTEVGRLAHNRLVGAAEAGRMVGISRKSGPRRCPMSRQGSLPVPPRALRQRESFRSTSSGRS
jgi:hypothetical protein